MQKLYGIDIIKNNKKLHGLFITVGNGNIRGIFQKDKNNYEKFNGKLNDKKITIEINDKKHEFLYTGKTYPKYELNRNFQNVNDNFEIPEILKFKNKDYKVQIIHKNNEKTYFDQDLIDAHYALLETNYDKETTKKLSLTL